MLELHRRHWSWERFGVNVPGHAEVGRPEQGGHPECRSKMGSPGRISMNLLVLSWHCAAAATLVLAGTTWGFTGAALVQHWCYTGTLQRYCTSAALELHWYCTGTVPKWGLC